MIRWTVKILQVHHPHPLQPLMKWLKIKNPQPAEVEEKTNTGIEGSAIEQHTEQSESLSRQRALNLCQQEIDSSITHYPIVFAAGIAYITVDNTTSIEKVAEIINSCPTYNVSVIGHTDSSGSESGNIKLSKLRAQSVKDKLNELGVDNGLLSHFGFGSSQPIASNQTEEGRSQNRRIEILLSLVK